MRGVITIYLARNSTMSKENSAELIDKYLAGKCSEQEKAVLESWYLVNAASATDTLPEPDYVTIEKEMWPVIERASNPAVKRRRLWPRIAAAATLLFALSFGFYTYHLRQAWDAEKRYATNIPPGGSKAYLTLADGKKISLTDAGNGQIAEQSGNSITKTEDGRLIYVSSKQAGGAKNTDHLNNTIETPKGGQYQVQLPDGTKVWLNAATSLSYPSTFALLKDRKVALKGEAYFEVAKDKTRPFIVHADQQDIEVLGTHFNMSVYPDEPAAKTTLLEGSVKVSVAAEQQILKPGEQAVTLGSRIKISPADTEQALDWKNGDFMFKKESLAEVMRKVSRWYDITVVYEKDVDQLQTFSGLVSRSKNISAVLKIMESTGQLRFSITGRKVTVMK